MASHIEYIVVPLRNKSPDKVCLFYLMENDLSLFVKTWYCTNAHHIFVCNEQYLCKAVTCVFKKQAKVRQLVLKRFIFVLSFFTASWTCTMIYLVCITNLVLFQILLPRLFIDWKIYST